MPRTLCSMMAKNTIMVICVSDMVIAAPMATPSAEKMQKPSS